MAGSGSGRSKKASTPARAEKALLEKLKNRAQKARARAAEKSPAGQEATALFERVVSILEDARSRVVRTVHSEMVLAYWHIGRVIVEHLQGGDARAEYGEQVLETLSARLSQRYGKGFSITNLRYFRLFYQTYAERRPEIHHGARDESAPGRGPRQKPRQSGELVTDLAQASQPVDSGLGFESGLSWTHYRTLTRVPDRAARRFYELEAAREGWSVPHLERQIHTQLFTRLLKSRDKSGVLELATRGQVLERPVDSLRDPYVLDFLSLPEAHQLRESDLEDAILGQLQAFLLELGKGFAFVARQKRLAYDDEHFYVDLVFYNCILKCYLLIDLKVGRLSHQDVGQMDSYVRLWDDQQTTEGDNPTIGLILCAEKNEAVARYSVLNENKQIFAAKYVTYLPTEEELARELQRERLMIEARGALAGPNVRQGVPVDPEGLGEHER
ncbi:MAG: PDDEXK nuclease domain-containing protein [Polyangia bacterium]